ncbi:tetratricopeptide repeat protein [Butyricimonas sp. Marseille-P3923]|uniref:tetratricopeptide repeat protein n=1 Tax=Butyricimonas sp. Marseille-P3923 TaxID=1987504 RepID=UPI000C083F8E|nr:tetratricopeptide repeat protein [Butyricimonas sp. Marseille-P3923]
MNKLVKSLFVILFLLCAIQVFADKKKAVEPTLEGEAKVQFDYAFMEGVRFKILGDLKSSLTYFDQCMKIYNRSAAVRYEISSILSLGEDLNLPLQLMREAVQLEPDNIWYNLLLANILQKKSMIEEACKVYDELIAKHPEREDFYIIQVDLYTSTEKWEKAIEVLNRYEKQFGVNEPAIIEKAKLYSKMDNVKRASSEIMKLIKKYPENTDYLGLLAELYLSHNQEKKGLQLLNRIVKDYPDNGFVQFYLADYYRTKKDSLNTEKYIRPALANDNIDNNLKVQYLLKLLVNQADLSLSTDHIYRYVQLLLEKYPGDLSVRTLNADFLKRENKLEECKKELEFIISKEKNNYLVWEELMFLSNQLGDTAAMKSEGLECLNYFPNEPLPYMMISLPMLIEGNYAKATGYLQKGLELAPDKSFIKSQLYAYLGECYYKQDSIEIAFSMFDSAIAINPNDIMTLNNYSYYLSLRNERLNQAEKMISTALSADPNNATFLDTYAWVLFKLKNYSLARFYMRSAIENTEKPSGVLYEHYGDILYMNGDKEEALKMWKKALELGDDISDNLKNKIVNGLSVEHEE